MTHMIFTTEGFFEVAIESRPEWDLNPQLLNFVQNSVYILLSCYINVLVFEIYLKHVSFSKYFRAISVASSVQVYINITNYSKEYTYINVYTYMYIHIYILS